MKIISRIIGIHFILLIAYLNSGLFVDRNFYSKLINQEDSFPSSDRFLIHDQLTCPVSDLRIREDLIPCRPEKFIRKIKLLQNLKINIPFKKKFLFPSNVKDQDPAYHIALFGSSEISFPFTFFG